MNGTRNAAVLALAIVFVVVVLAVAIFLLSGHKVLLTQFLSSTVQGNIRGVAFTTGGPFGMWIIAFLLLRYAGQNISLGSIRLYLRFPEPQVNPPPTGPSQFHESECFYSVFSGDAKIIPDKSAKILIDSEVNAPYIYVSVPKCENPEFEVSLIYSHHKWISNSFSPKTGNVELQ